MFHIKENIPIWLKWQALNSGGVNIWLYALGQRLVEGHLLPPLAANKILLTGIAINLKTFFVVHRSR